uniref:Neuronal acetylcholine receptor subunit alpha-7-like n=1 Tax=Stegastes partitus TaxID=144197 RepID=A0A3B5B8A5_9TELE
FLSQLSLLFFLLFCLSVQGPHQRFLLRELLRDYNPMERPVANDSQPLTVQFSFTLMQVMDVDEKNQILTTNAWLQMQWYDHYLQWNQSEYPGVKNLRFTPDQVWTPDILLYNSAHDKFDATFKTNVLVNSSGFCEYLPPGIFVSTCSVDVRWFPFDIQRCELKFGSWTFDGWLLDIQMKEADVSGYMPNGEWDLLEVPGGRHEVFYDCCAEPYPDITFVVTLRRRTLFYALNLLIPCVLLSSMTLVVFLLPANSGEKISLGITVLLSLTVFMLMVAEIMPATSDSVPLIGQYFASTMVIVGMSVVATVIVLQFHHHNPNSGHMPRWVSWNLQMERFSKHHRSHAVPNASPNGHLPYMGFQTFQTTAELEPVQRCRATSHGRSNSGLVGGEGELQALLAEVQYLVERVREQDRQLSLAEQWQFAAAVIDRLCLVGFSVFNIICTIAILMAAPNFGEALSKDFL